MPLQVHNIPRIAFVGDLVSTSGWPRVQCSFADDWSLIPDSLARLQALRPEWVYAGHGRCPLSGEALQRLTPKFWTQMNTDETDSHGLEEQVEKSV